MATARGPTTATASTKQRQSNIEAAETKKMYPDAESPTNALLRAAYEGNVELLMKMLSDGIPVDVANQGGLQAIHFAAKAGRVEIIDELISRGAKVDAKSTKGNTPLHVASLLGKAEVIKLLLRHGADVNAVAECNDDEFSPLYMAAQIGHQVIVTLLLAHGSDPTIPTKNGCTPCDVALQQGHKAVSELLSEYEKRINAEAEAAAPSDGETDQSSTMESPTSEDTEEDSLVEELPPLKVEYRKKPARKARPKSGPPPVCEEAIPSPKPSPLRSQNNKSSP